MISYFFSFKHTSLQTFCLRVAYAAVTCKVKSCTNVLVFYFTVMHVGKRNKNDYILEILSQFCIFSKKAKLHVIKNELRLRVK